MISEASGNISQPASTPSTRPASAKSHSAQLPLNLQWTFGFNQINGHSIHNFGASKEQKFILYSASHTIVLYDTVNKRQRLLQGHANSISCLMPTVDKRWFVSADKGRDSMIIIWESVCSKPENSGHNADMEALLHAFPIKNIYNPHGGFGVQCAEFTHDSKYLITLGNEPEQTVAVWDWTKPTSEPVISCKVGGKHQTLLKINPKDPFEFLTLGPDSVYFYIYTEELNDIVQHTPAISEQEQTLNPSTYTCATFHPSNRKAVVGNTHGDLITFEDKNLEDFSERLGRGDKCAIKYLAVHSNAITHLSTANDCYIVVGTEDGQVKIFDLDCRIVFWYNKLTSGPITSIVVNLFHENLFDDSRIPEIIVASMHSMVYTITRNPESNLVPFQPEENDNLGLDKDEDEKNLQNLENESKRSGNPHLNVILQGYHGNITGLETMPSSTKFIVAGNTGCLQIWDVSQRVLLASRMFTHQVPIESKKKVTHHRKEDIKYAPKHLAVTSIALSKSGRTLAVGFVNGRVKFLDTVNLLELATSTSSAEEGHEASKVAIVKIAFSPDGDFCSMVDEDHALALFHKETIKLKTSVRETEAGDDAAKSVASGAANSEEGDIKRVRSRVEWISLGRCKTHFKPVVALLYSTIASSLQLFSVSQDKHVVAYELSKSNKTDGINIKHIHRIEQLYEPSSAILMQKNSASQPEEFIMTFNSGLKSKLYASETQLCRRTTLGPTFAGVVNGLQVIPWAGEANYVTFTSGNILGLAKLPLDGNPYRYAGIIGHANNISNVTVTHNGSHLISAGGADGIINIWTMNSSVIDSQIGYGGEGMEPFYHMLDPESGKEGDIYREFQDYFYYGQIKSQGESVAIERIVGDTVQLNQIASIMQAMGYYPSNQEIDDMKNEVKYGKIADGESNAVTSVNLDELIKLYLNFRPVLPLTREDLVIALSHARRLENGRPNPSGTVPVVADKQQIREDGLFNLLGQYGESMNVSESKKLFRELLLETEPYYGNFPSKFTSTEFIGKMLGMSVQDEVEGGERKS